MIYFTSDWHLGHEGIIQLAKRPFRNIGEMNRTLIDIYNSIVSDRDTVYLLGDLAHKLDSEEANKMFKRLKGKKHLIIGNHDNHQSYDSRWFEEITHYSYIHADGVRLALMHYPMLDWEGAHSKGSYMLHGHMHNFAEYNRSNRDKGIRRYDVGVDANEYRPVSLQEIVDFFGERP